MGQYYVPTILDEKGKPEITMGSWDFNSGLKLMEHSWLDNEFVAAFEGLLVQEAPRRVVWAGDYADAEVTKAGKKRTHTWVRPDGTAVVADLNIYVLAGKLEPYRPDVPGLGETYNRINGELVVTKDPEIQPNAFPTVLVRTETHPFIVNHDKKEFVDKRRVERETGQWTGDNDYRIHPLPLLTAEGNGRGGGDFRGEDSNNLIGRWARDHISVSSIEPEGFTEIKFDLHE